MQLPAARLAVLAGTLALIALLAAPRTAFALRWSDCDDFVLLRCGEVVVPLDYGDAEPGQLALRVAREGRSTGPTLLYLSGGPGSAGVSEMAAVVSMLPALTQRYRVIGFDQRGTGGSELLRCPALEHDRSLRSTSAAALCAATLGPDRTHYTTADSVHDVETIRLALGVQRLTLYGISYGTQLALDYARRYPQHVERMIVDSVVDPDATDPWGTASYRAMATTLKALCPNRCRGISSDPAGDLARLVARLRERPLRAVAYGPGGRAHALTIGPTALLDLMLDSDYAPSVRAAVPAAVVAALAGDGAPLARLVRELRTLLDLGPPSEFSSARYAAICEEAPLPWAPGTPIERRPAALASALAALPADAFFPFDHAAALADEIDLCLRWPDVPRGPSLPAPPLPRVPTLVLQGAEDLRTPPADSARVAAQIPGAQRLVVPGIGHGVSTADRSGCAARAIGDFVGGRRVPRRCRRVPTRVPAVRYPPRSAATLRALAGLPPRVGRTLSAVQATLADLEVVLSPAVLANTGGGLRGGSWAVSPRGRLTLRDYAGVAGVTLSGGGSRSLTLRVGGSRAAHGTLVLRGDGRVTGTLGAERVALWLDAARAATSALARTASGHAGVGRGERAPPAAAG